MKLWFVYEGKNYSLKSDNLEYLILKKANREQSKVMDFLSENNFDEYIKDIQTKINKQSDNLFFKYSETNFCPMVCLFHKLCKRPLKTWKPEEDTYDGFLNRIDLDIFDFETDRIKEQIIWLDYVKEVYEIS